MDVEVINRQRRLSLDRREIAAIVQSVMKAEKVDGDVSIMYVGAKKMTEFNLQYFEKNKPTDVISFPLREKLPNSGTYFGDIVVCTDVAVDEASARNIDPKRELYLYTVHGVLHLLGYNDDTPDKRTKMNRKAASLLEGYLKEQARHHGLE